MDHNQQGQGQSRRHFHRGRRGPDRRALDRRGPQPQTPEQAGRGDVDVEQIMADIRARIAQQHGIELTNQQIQELAARRLESILDPRSVKPALLDQLRRAAGTPPTAAAPSPQPPYTFEDTTLYDSHRGLMRFIRKLLNPILKLFFNPNPLIQALNVQAKLNTETVAREEERNRRQAEWNALHYEILQRVVTEISRATLEVQSLSLRMESLAAKVDFNERRVRGIEGAVHQGRPTGRREEARREDVRREDGRREEGRREDGRRDEGRREEVRRDVQETPVAQVVVQPAEPAALEATPANQTGEGTRRRRRRRRGRRGGGTAGETTAAGATESTALDGEDLGEGPEEDEGIPALAGADLPNEPAELLSPDVSPASDEIVVAADPADTPDARHDLLPHVDDVRTERADESVIAEALVVVADAEPSRPDTFAVAPEPGEQAPALTAAEEPDRPADELAAPGPSERRDLEPTDK
jgi:hypothetical protein